MHVPLLHVFPVVVSMVCVCSHTCEGLGVSRLWGPKLYVLLPSVLLAMKSRNPLSQLWEKANWQDVDGWGLG